MVHLIDVRVTSKDKRLAKKVVNRINQKFLLQAGFCKEAKIYPFRPVKKLKRTEDGEAVIAQFHIKTHGGKKEISLILERLRDLEQVVCKEIKGDYTITVRPPGRE